MKKKPSSPGFVRQEIGSGITKRARTRFSGPLNVEGLEALKDTLSRAGDCPFAALEETLRGFLRDAGIPDDPTEGGKHPFRLHVTPELAESAYHSGTWYTAAILDEISRIRWLHGVSSERDRRAVYDAALAGFRAGDLHREGVMKFEWEPDALRGVDTLKGARSKKPPRRIIELENYIHYRRENGELSYKEFKEELENTENGDALEWRGFQFWINEDFVYVQEKTHDEEIKARSISVESLPRYWNRPPIRAK
jgi:hypothetical protein